MSASLISEVPGDGFTLSASRPHPPDFLYCHNRYGTDLSTADCAWAANELPHGAEQEVYPNNGGSDPFSLPMVRKHGDCTITVDYAYPVRYSAVRLIPNVIRLVAAGIIYNCVMYGGGIGGFATQGFVATLEHFNDPSRNLSEPWPYERSMGTITVSGPGGAKHPGMLDPVIPLQLYSAQRIIDDEIPTINTDPLAIAFLQMSSQATPFKPWWEYVEEYISAPNAVQDKMTYKCDSNLGAPTEADCSRLERSQLGSPSDTVEIGPGKPKMLLSKTCSVTVSSSTSILLTWAQIGAALDTLISLCVANPIKSGRGGRAYYATQGYSRVSRRNNKRSVSGLNALPPHVSIELYQPGHDPNHSIQPLS